MENDKKKEESAIRLNRDEIIWNITNCGIATFISFASGVIATGFEFSIKNVLIALTIGVLTGLIKFRDYWNTQEREYTKKILNFI